MTSNLKFEFTKKDPTGKSECESSVVVKCTHCSTRFSVGFDQIKLDIENKFKCFCCDEVFIAEIATPKIDSSVVETSVVDEPIIKSSTENHVKHNAAGNQFAFRNYEQAESADSSEDPKDTTQLEPPLSDSVSKQHFGFNSGLKIKSKIRPQGQFQPNNGSGSVKDFSPRKDSQSFSFARFKEDWQPRLSSSDINLSRAGRFCNLIVENIRESLRGIYVGCLRLGKSFLEKLNSIRIQPRRLFSRAFLWFGVALFLTLLACFLITKYTLANPTGFNSIFSFAAIDTPNYPVSGVGIKNLELKKVVMANGESVDTVSGSFYNNSRQQVRMPAIETVVFNSAGQVSQKQVNYLYDNLDGVLLSNLTIRDLFNIPQENNVSEAIIQPEEIVPFTFALKSDSIDTRFFTTRVYSIS